METLTAAERFTAMPDGVHGINLDLIPLADGWAWHVYRGAHHVSTRWIVRTDAPLIEGGPPLCTYRCLTCGFETGWSVGLGAHNQKHDRAESRWQSESHRLVGHFS